MTKNIFYILFLLSLIYLSSCSYIKFPPSLNNSNSIYNLTLSKDYVILGVASYCDKKCLQSWTCQITTNYLPNDKVIHITHFMGIITRAAGFVAYDQTKNLIVVSLRGSANIQNWISDFSFEAIDYMKCKGCKVHIGFMEDYKSIEKNLNLAVDALVQKYPNAGIVVTGHSMGAALSVIVGIQLKLRLNKFVEIHNIGSPRVGNDHFAQFVNIKIDKLFRLVHYKDLIPHLPPLQLGFHHSSYEVFFDKQMSNYTICSQNGEDKNCSNKFFPNYNPADHDFYFWDLGKILKC